ncbi:c-type cytochrome [Marinobacter zhanjiangensis]|uniref:Cytochrome c biogenesis protein CcsB n=1 Tax=Marinobacter zhanjiangensis TaxID=578215 RepID=A0ABQ3AZI1_9GAMM|nr:c-type cytochrome [Marinobacter zhanjiangensis]GGY71756.1 cytochrome c biogenesis protein CcsB [Marinobacter zhanjiangensis]
MRKTVLCAVAAILTIGTAHAQAADASAGKAMFENSCAQCHGKQGQGMASFPSLKGNEAEYIESRLETYRAGEKVGANSGLMIPNAKDLSDDDIANLAAYISSSFK